MAIEQRLYKKYKEEIISLMQKEFSYKSIMQAPKIKKIVINMGVGQAVNDKSIATDAQQELTKITGQYALLTKAKNSNASFKIRTGMPIGVVVTLRGQKMWDFLDKLINIGFPRIRDFRGVKEKAFDGRGNYTVGVPEFIVFPEIDLDKVKNMKGMDISIITSTNSDKEAYRLLDLLGMPFKSKWGGGK